MLPQSQLPYLRDQLRLTILALIGTGVSCFIAGGARGFDALAAKTVLALRQKHPDIKLLLALPCKTQSRGWNETLVAEYEDIKARADRVHYVSEQFTPTCMHRRNDFMVSKSGTLICYKARESGGTAYTVRQAQMQGLQIINLAPPEEDRTAANAP